MRPWWHQNSLEASEVKLDLRFEINNLNNPCIHAHVVYNIHFVTSEAMVASKRPQRLHLASELNSVTSITYVAKLLWPANASMR